jgi:hypothetical protein
MNAPVKSFVVPERWKSAQAYSGIGTPAPVEPPSSDLKQAPQAVQPAARKLEGGKSHLAADADQVRRFVEGVFRNCVDENRRPFTGRLVLRAFEHRNNKCVLSTELAFGPGFVSSAVEEAGKIANRPADDAAVFAPPPCLFNPFSDKARQADVIAAPVIAVDLDKADPDEGRRKLEALLGPATLVIASGGVWIGPNGSEKAKLHLYWRLTRPARSVDDIWLLNSVRKAAAKFIGGDTSAASPAHPMRWPGSWHTKGEPRLCRIIGGDVEREIALGDAARLLKAEEQTTTKGGREPGSLFFTKEALTSAQLLDVAENLPNRDLDWEAWNSALMAFYDASHDSSEGKEAARIWSAKAAKHDDDTFDARWEHIGAHPPERLNAKSLERLVQEAQAGTEGPIYVVPPADPSPLTEEQKAALAELWRPRESSVKFSSVEPADIFGDEPPMKLRTPPAGCLPEMLSRWVRSEARRKGASEAFTAAAALATIGGAIGNSMTIQVRAIDADYVQPAPVWCVLVADPGSAKSPVTSAALKPLKEVDREWHAADWPKYSAWLAASKEASRKRQPLPPEPRLRCALVDDLTTEAQLKIHAANPRGILRAPDEFVGIVEGLGAYKKSGGGDRTMLLRSFDGESVKVNRATTVGTYAQNALMGILASTQPDKLKTLVQNMQADGLLQRCLFILDEGERIKACDEEADAEAAREYRAMVHYLANASYPFSDPVRMSPDGYEVFEQFRALTEAMLNTPGMNSAWKGHLRKFTGIAARFVLTFHAVEQFELMGAVNPDLPVGRGTVERAMAWCRFALRHSYTFYRDYFAPDEQHDDALFIAGYLLTHPEHKKITRRSIYHARTSLKGGANTAALLKVAGLLVDAGWLAVSKYEPGGATEWAVNPRIHERFAARAELERVEREKTQALMKESFEARRLLRGEA